MFLVELIDLPTSSLLSFLKYSKLCRKYNSIFRMFKYTRLSYLNALIKIWHFKFYQIYQISARALSVLPSRTVFPRHRIILISKSIDYFCLLLNFIINRFVSMNLFYVWLLSKLCLCDLSLLLCIVVDHLFLLLYSILLNDCSTYPFSYW